jgi:uncharacterized protein YjbI with pentapeptide repeats
MHFASRRVFASAANWRDSASVKGQAMELNVEVNVEQMESAEVEAPAGAPELAQTDEPRGTEAVAADSEARADDIPAAPLPESLAEEMSMALSLIASSESSAESSADLSPETPFETEAEPAAVLPSTMREVLDQHLVWLHSEGRAGHQANLCRVDLSGADLTDVNLRDAVLHRAVLKGADLLLTDFQGASLLQADLQGTNLLGAKLQEANLQGATLQEATGLQPEQLAGANLFGAALPAQVSVQTGLRHLGALAKLSGWLILVMVALSAMTWLRIITTTDVQLLVNGPVLPMLGLHDLLPLVPFYLCGPVAMLGLYICFHLGLQHLWDGAAAQPAIFPDGRRLDACLPWFARWPARSRMKWLREHRPSLAALEAGISILLLYWMVPLTMLLFWARYLTMQDLRGTMMHVILVVAASAAALYFTRAAGRAYKTAPRNPWPRNPWFRRAVAPSFGLLLATLSFGAIRGVPHSAGRPVDVAAAGGPQSWAADLLWWAGYTPTAQLSESDVSVKPAGWTGRDEDLTRVEGARLNGLRLRYIQAYGAFFAKARLWQADLSHANLSETDLREANLRQASLEGATVDKARLARAVLQEADLRGANLTQSDLQDANLSRAMMAGAHLPDAKLDGANLYASDLRDAVLQRASLQHADLRDAQLEGADLSMAILRQTYLSSAKMSGSHLQGAQLAQAFLTQADLRNADLRGAGLQGAILNGANLTGAKLDQVDLRGALGITASQVCSAGSTRQVQLDDTLQQEVQSLCGSKP